jgi:hypothetical protein
VRIYLVACVVSVVICVGGYFLLNTIQKPTGIAFATDGARISPHWVWRSVLSPSEANELTRKVASIEECNRRKAWQWIFVDFGWPAGESKICTDSQ